MSQMFNEVRVANTSRSTFDLSHHQVTTSDFGYIIPICYRDMVPNDDFVVSPSLFCRLAPLANPTYGKVKCRVHSFFVPYRICYPDWDDFIVSSGASHTLPPYFTVQKFREMLNKDRSFQSGAAKPRGFFSRVMSNLGLNPSLLLNTDNLSTSQRIAAFPFLAYYRIWMDYFADSNLYNHASMSAAFRNNISNGGNIDNYIEKFCQQRFACFDKDYFTTTKENPQDGTDPSRVAVALGRDVNRNLNYFEEEGFGTAIYSDPQGNDRVSGKAVYSFLAPYVELNDNIGQFTVEELRAAVAYQRYLERNNYVGTKLVNQLLAHFGIAPEAERIDMAEYIGGSNFPIQIGDVTSTAAYGSGSTAGLGAQAGKGIGGAHTETVRYHAKEHGIFMTVLSILPESAYYQGLSRFWTKGINGDPFDYYTPEFENLGYQEVLNREVYLSNVGDEGDYNDYDPEGIFGYTPRFSEYKFAYDILGSDFVAGAGGSPFASTMDSWHLFRKLFYDDNNPLVLNSNFTECNNYNESYDRIFQVTDNELDHFYFNIEVDVKATRPMVGFAEPALDHTNSDDGNKINLPYGGTRL